MNNIIIKRVNRNTFDLWNTSEMGWESSWSRLKHTDKWRVVGGVRQLPNEVFKAFLDGVKEV